MKKKEPIKKTYLTKSSNIEKLKKFLKTQKKNDE